MKLLLDTHIWIWSRAEPARLRPKIAQALEDPANELWLSPLSVWELFLLAAKGRVLVGVEVEKWVRLALERVPVKEASLTREVAMNTREVRLPHRDPVDLFLAATARFYDLTLVTADQRLLAGTGFSILPNR